MAPLDQGGYDGQRPEGTPEWWWKKFVEIALRVRTELANVGLSENDYGIPIPHEIVASTTIVLWDSRHVTVDFLIACCRVAEAERDKWAIGVAARLTSGADPTPILQAYNGAFLPFLMEDWVRELIIEALTRMGKSVPEPWRGRQSKAAQ